MAPPSNIDYEITLANVRKAFPKLRKPENIAKVILASISLGAVSRDTAKKRFQLESKGTSSYGVSLSVKLEILQIKKFNSPPFFQYHRPVPKPKTEIERENALKLERSLMYKRLMEESEALANVVAFLKLGQDSKLSDVKNLIEEGDLFKQIKYYDDIFKKALKEKGWHNDTYDYYWLGYRRRSALYWLTNKGQRLVARKP